MPASSVGFEAGTLRFFVEIENEMALKGNIKRGRASIFFKKSHYGKKKASVIVVNRIAHNNNAEVKFCCWPRLQLCNHIGIPVHLTHRALYRREQL